MPVKHLKSRKILIAKTSGLAGAEFRNRAFAGGDFRKTNLSGATFVGCSFKGARFWGAKLDGASFEDCDLRGTVFKETTLVSALFERSDLCDAKFLECDMNEARFEESLLRGADISCDGLEGLSLTWCLADHLSVGAEELIGCEFRHCKLGGATFVVGECGSLKDSDKRVTFESCSLEQVDFSRTNFRSCRIQNCHADEVRFGGGEGEVFNLSVRNSTLTSAAFDECHINGGGFFESDLSGSSFREAKLVEVGFDEVDLRDCDFAYMDAHYCDPLAIDDDASDFTVVGWTLGEKTFVNICDRDGVTTCEESDLTAEWQVDPRLDEDQAEWQTRMMARQKAAALDVLSTARTIARLNKSQPL